MQRSWKNAEGQSENRKKGVKEGEEEQVGRKKKGYCNIEILSIGAYFQN